VVDDLRPVGAEAEATRVLFGPLRADVRGEAVSTAPDVPADGSFVLGAHAARAWVFVTDRGDVFASPTFLGALRPIGALRCAPRHPRPEEAHILVMRTPSAGRLVLHEGGQLAWTDGASLRFEGDARVVDLAWRNERQGVRIVEDRGLEATDDGGNTWGAVRGAPGLPVMLAGRADALFALTTERVFRIDAGGEATAATVPTPPLGLQFAQEVFDVFERGGGPLRADAEPYPPSLRA